MILGSWGAISAKSLCYVESFFLLGCNAPLNFLHILGCRKPLRTNAAL
jgi:hypothetical protein